MLISYIVISITFVSSFLIGEIAYCEEITLCIRITAFVLYHGFSIADICDDN